MSCIKNGSTQKLAVDSFVFFFTSNFEESPRPMKEKDKYLTNDRDACMFVWSVACVKRCICRKYTMNLNVVHVYV